MSSLDLRYKRASSTVPRIPIATIDEYVRAVTQISAIWREHARTRPIVKNDPFPGEIVPWFRGVTDASYRCEPGILRDVPEAVRRYNHSAEGIAQLEDYMLHRFKGQGIPHTSLGKSDPKIEWMYLMQHHGLPTRLLDWTKNSLTALYFAIRKDKRIPSAVWVIDPRRLNEACGLGRRISAPLRSKSTRVTKYVEATSKSWINQHPIPIIPSHVSDRLAAQQSRFTLHAPRAGGVEAFALATAKDDGVWHAACLILEKGHRDLLRALRLLGVTETEITPGLDTLSREILHRMQLGFDDLDFAGDAKATPK